MSPSCIAFGPNGTWVSVFDDDDDNSFGIKWSEGLPQKMVEILNGRYGPNQNQRCSPITSLAYDENQYIFFFANGKYKGYNIDEELEEEFEGYVQGRSRRDLSTFLTNWLRMAYIMF